jgi:hypothetical protein
MTPQRKTRACIGRRKPLSLRGFQEPSEGLVGSPAPIVAVSGATFHRAEQAAPEMVRREGCGFVT